MHKFVLTSALLISSGCGVWAGEMIQGKDRDTQILSITESTAPGRPDHIIRQMSMSYKVNASTPAFTGTAFLVAHAEINGDTGTFRGFGANHISGSSDVAYFDVTGHGKAANGQMSEITGTFQWVGGEGKLQNLRGGGPFTCKFGPGTINGCDWTGTPEGVAGL